MQISPTSSSLTARSIPSAKSSSDKDSNEKTQELIVEKKPQENVQEQRRIQDNLQQKKEEDQRRLDGRLISFGKEEATTSNEQNQTAFNRSRVNDAYSPPKSDSGNFREQHTQMSKHKDSEAIDVVV